MPINCFIFLGKSMFSESLKTDLEEISMYASYKMKENYSGYSDCMLSCRNNAIIRYSPYSFN